MIHASDILNTIRCPRLGWNIYHREKGRYEPYANLIRPLFELAAEKLQLHGLPAGKTGDTMERTRQLLREKRGGVRLRFEREGIRTTIPFLVPVCSTSEVQEERQLTGRSAKKRNYQDLEYEIIYPFLSMAPTDRELKMIALNDWILQGSQIRISSHRILHVNKDYVRQEDLDADGLLSLEDHLFRKSGHPCDQTIDQQLAETDHDQLLEEIHSALQILQDDQPDAVKVRHCLAPRRCIYYEDCFDESSEADDSIHFLSSAARRAEMMEEGISTLKETDPEKIEGFPLQYAQIQAARSENGQFLDARAAASWIDALQYPLIYLDFEWDTFAFPPYSGMIPYDVLCFEYSMHIEQKDGSVTHYGFFENGDCRRHFIETLIERIPEEGSVIVYNMEGAEKLRLMQLSRQFPEYAQKLASICSRMVDLSVLFEKGIFYDLRQRGHYTLKTMIDVLDDGPGYSKLSVRNGLEAIDAYRRVCASRDETEIRSLARRIDEYCAMDTEAEMILLHALQDRLDIVNKAAQNKKDSSSAQKPPKTPKNQINQI